MRQRENYKITLVTFHKNKKLDITYVAAVYLPAVGYGQFTAFTGGASDRPE